MTRIVLKKRRPIGRVIRRARERKNLTREDVAKACKVSLATVYLWEDRRFILRKHFRALARCLDVSVMELERTNGVSPWHLRKGKTS